MIDPNKKNEDSKKVTEECDGNIDCAAQTLHESVAQSHPEWVDDAGECSSCVSLEHELAADPANIPEDLI